MKISENFELEEFVSRDVFERWQGKALWFLDYKIINIAEYFLKAFKTEMIINNWKSGGEFQNRGFRAPDCKEGDPYSLHRFGKALDFNLTNIDPEDVRQHIRDKFIHLRLVHQIAAIETGIDWVHVDVRNNWNSTRLIEFKK